MDIVIVIMKLSVYFIVVPLLLGAVAGTLGKNRMSWLERYAAGYVVYLALFYGMNLPYVRNVCNRSFLTQRWIWYARVIGGAALGLWLICIVLRKWFSQKSRNGIPRKGCDTPTAAQDSNGISAKLRIAVVMLGIATVVMAVFFLMPHIGDTTAASVRLALEKEEIMLRDPYTASEIGGVSSYFLPVYYMTAAAVSGLDAAAVVQLFFPVALLPVFYGIYSWISRWLFGKDSWKRWAFLLLIEGFYLCMTLREVYIGLAVFQNIWNPETLLVSCILPFLFFLSMDLAQRAAKAIRGRLRKNQAHGADEKLQDSANGKLPLSAYMEPAVYLLLWLCCFPAAQLCLIRGVFAAAVTAVSAGIWNFAREMIRGNKGNEVDQ